MNTNLVLNGTANGFTAAGFGKTTLVNQLGFLVGVATMRKANPARDVPVWDASITEALGDTGQTTIKELDLDELVKGYAAAFVLLLRHVNTPHPETGRKEEHLRKFLKAPKEIVAAAAAYSNEKKTSKNVAQAMATAAMLKVDPTARIAAIKKEADIQTTIDVGPIETTFKTALTEYKDFDNQSLIDEACDALTNGDRNVGLEIKKSAAMYLEKQKERLLNGEFVAVDAGIYALAQ